MTNHYLAADASATGWDQTIYAFLAEKERRSGSMRTVETYSRMLFHFFGALGKPPDQVVATEGPDLTGGDDGLTFGHQRLPVFHGLVQGELAACGLNHNCGIVNPQHGGSGVLGHFGYGVAIPGHYRAANLCIGSFATT